MSEVWQSIPWTHSVPMSLWSERRAKARLGLSAARNQSKGPPLSVGRQEAFDIFRRDHEDSVTFEDNKALLKQRFAEAKALGEQVNGARNKINELKKQLEQRRMQRAAQAVVGVPVAQEEADPVEEMLCRQIEEEKKSYKDTFGRLKGLRTAIEHLQLLLDKAKVKLQRDFNEWWDREEAQLQEPRSEGGAMARSAGRSSQQPTAPHPTSDVHVLPARTKAKSFDPSAQDLRSITSSGPAVIGDSLERRGTTNPLQLRDLCVSTSSSSSSIPLTGDQQADADILAFIRARHNLLSRPGQMQSESF